MADALKAFEAELESKNFKGYWQNVQGDVNREPVPSFEPCHWKGKIFCRHGKAWDGRLGCIVPARNPNVESFAQKRHLAHVGFESSVAQARRGCAVTPPYGWGHRFILKGHGSVSSSKANHSRSAKVILSPRPVGPGTTMRITVARP